MSEHVTYQVRAYRSFVTDIQTFNVLVRRDFEGGYYATEDTMGCGKTRSTWMHAIGQLLHDHSYTVVDIRHEATEEAKGNERLYHAKVNVHMSRKPGESWSVRMYVNDALVSMRQFPTVTEASAHIQQVLTEQQQPI
jgi:hypothetical protein